MGQRPVFARQADPELVPLHRLGGLLARWHCWRKDYRTERSYARLGGSCGPEDALEEMLMHAIECEVECLPMHTQRALQQLARAECLGIEVDDTTSGEHAAALDRIAHRLRAIGIL